MKRMLLLTCLLHVAFGVFGQTNNVVVNTLQGDGYTYIQKIHAGLMTLYNSEKVYVDIPLVYKSTGERPLLREKRVEDEAWSFIPLSVFREIEVKLKEEIYFTLTEAGRNVNYVFWGWNHEVK